jgi:hypothetical protein
MTKISSKPTLAGPIVVAEFWANRCGESIRVQLRESEGRLIVDMRKHFTDSDGRLQATKKGLALLINRLPELADGVNRALVKARELGLIAGEGGS